MNREILFLGATLIAAVLIYVFPPALSLCAAIITFFCIGYAVYDARYTLQAVERQCFVIAAVAALVGTVLPEIRSSLWFVAGIMLLRFIMQHFFAKDPEETVAEQNEEITLLQSKLSAREEDLHAANARIETLNADITAFSARSRKEAEALSYAEKEQYVEELTKLQTMLAQLEREKTAQDQYAAELEGLIQSQDAKTEQERAAHEAELQKLRDESADSNAKLAETRQLLAQASKDKEAIESLYLESKKNQKDDWKQRRSEEIAKELKQAFQKYQHFSMFRDNAHAKLFICDDEYYVITSFNVLSYHPRKKDTRREIGEMSREVLIKAPPISKDISTGLEVNIL